MAHSETTNYKQPEQIAVSKAKLINFPFPVCNVIKIHFMTDTQLVY